MKGSFQRPDPLRGIPIGIVAGQDDHLHLCVNIPADKPWMMGLGREVGLLVTRQRWLLCGYPPPLLKLVVLFVFHRATAGHPHTKEAKDWYWKHCYPLLCTFWFTGILHPLVPQYGAGGSR